jgi:hypothetical protein
VVFAKTHPLWRRSRAALWVGHRSIAGHPSNSDHNVLPRTEPIRAENRVGSLMTVRNSRYCIACLSRKGGDSPGLAE